MLDLKAGDPVPIIIPSKYTLFGQQFCPFTESVKLVLGYHNIDSYVYIISQHMIPDETLVSPGLLFLVQCSHDLINVLGRYDFIPIASNDKPDWFKKLSPTDKIPLFLYEGNKLIEFDLIMRFVDELHGEEASLMSICGEYQFNKAVKLVARFFKTVHSIAFCVEYSESDVIGFKQLCQEINDAIIGSYFEGDQLSLSDLAIFPQLDFFEVTKARIENLDPSLVCESKPNEHESQYWPVLIKYITQLRQLPFIANSRQLNIALARFSEAKRANQPYL